MDIIDEVINAINEGRQADALDLLRHAYADVASAAPGTGKLVSMTFFFWGRLVLEYQPAREAWARLRDEQAALLMQGDELFGEPSCWRFTESRFAQICDMNRALDESHATYALFVQLDRALPARAAQESYRALPSVVDAGDFALAERYLDDPLKQLDTVNQTASRFPLVPRHGEAPRLQADLSNYVQAVKLKIATLNGLGRPAEAAALHQAAVAGLLSTELRELAELELAAPGFDTMLAIHRRLHPDEEDHAPGVGAV